MGRVAEEGLGMGIRRGPRPTPQPVVQHLIRAGRVDLEGSLTVHPVVGPAKTRPFRTYHTDMARGKGLTQRAGIIGLHGLVVHIGEPCIALLVYAANFFEKLRHLFFPGVDLYLQFVEDLAVLGVKFGVKDGLN